MQYRGAVPEFADMSAARQLGGLLTKSELVDLLELVDAAQSAATESQFRNLLHLSSQLLPLERIHVSVAKLDDDDRIVGTSRSVNLNYPTDWLQHYREQGLMRADPVTALLFKSAGPIVWEQLRKQQRHAEATDFFGSAATFGLREGFSFGERFGRLNAASFFTCEGKDLTAHRRHLALVAYLLPHLHGALSRLQLSLLGKPVTLTPRETQVLQWIMFGKTDGQIALQLGISERAARFHADNAIAKLQANNRPHAISIALAMGLLRWS